jgi:hypothetical protein
LSSSSSSSSGSSFALIPMMAFTLTSNQHGSLPGPCRF